MLVSKAFGVLSRIGYVRGYGDLANVMLCYKAKRRKGPDTQGQDALIAQKQKCGI